MADTTVALLFDDEAPGSQLRQALHERGADIVHESTVHALDLGLIEQLAPDVLVVSLDESVDEESDVLYELIDRGFTRVVFNDAQASRGLGGWDLARWARHLAAKVLAQEDIDPPRPEAVMDNATPSADGVEESAGEAEGAEFPEPAAEPAQPVASTLDADLERDRQTSAEAEALAAELEPLMAREPAMLSDSLVERFFAGAVSTLDVDVANTEEPAAMSWPTIEEMESDNLSWGHGHPAEPPPSAAVHSDIAHADPAEPVDVTTSVETPLHETWSLVDEAAAPPAPTVQEQYFGIEKLSAVDYLAPPVEATSPSDELSMSLELVSLEESMASQPYQGEETSGDAARSDLGCVVLLGAAVDSGDSVRHFLSALPTQLRCAFVLVQHHRGGASAELAQELAAHCPLPVRVASADRPARVGELLVVPAGEQLTLLRDGSVDLQPAFGEGSRTPSIDATFSLIAKTFGSDTLAIMFAGPTIDAVGGCQAVHDHGGRVWVEQTGEDDFNDMVSGVIAERVATVIAQPHELAARLIEEVR